ncbi:MAG: tRNA pseudouridine(38-40) synthase TruA [Lachnospiraceae bacterium]|nr:tRNA pseudouridine(38-40) synthase TruA [Lachnospiraceae bacterium]
MRRILLQVAYDGTDYHGFALQDNVPTIEGELNRVISDLEGRQIEVIGASRTDAGVHAKKNIAVYDSFMNIEPEKVSGALNARLPDDIRIRGSFGVRDDFHPRKCSCIKTYVYTIINDRYDIPTRSRYACFVPVPLDAGKMDEGSKALLGEHDFKSFCSVHTQAESTVRTVTDIGVERRENEIVICVKGTGFLYNMVRIIAGTLIEVGRGKIQPGEVKEILDAADRRKAGPTAKPRGLCLEDIRFMDEDHTGEPI